MVRIINQFCYVCFLILDLNVVKDEIFLISFGSLDHRHGPKYLTQDPENHTLFSCTYPYRPNTGLLRWVLPDHIFVPLTIRQAKF